MTSVLHGLMPSILKSVVSYILSIHFGCSDKRVNLAPVIPSWSLAEVLGAGFCHGLRLTGTLSVDHWMLFSLLLTNVYEKTE